MKRSQYQAQWMATRRAEWRAQGKCLTGCDRRTDKKPDGTFKAYCPYCRPPKPKRVVRAARQAAARASARVRKRKGK